MFDIRELKGEAELTTASSLIDVVQIYGMVPPAYLQGTTMFGIFDPDGGMFGCLMAIVQGPHAYIDYLAIHPLMQGEGYATELVKYVRSALYAKGVRDVHACVQGENSASLRVCAKLSPLVGFPYTKLRFRLGKEEGRSHG